MAKSERGAAAASTLVFLAIGALYTFTAARHVLGGDNGELVAVGASGGVAHPPGYPLYVLILRASTLLPGVSPAHRAALATAMVATFAVAALAWAARAWGASRVSSTAIAALYGVGPLAWILGSHAEVFALNVLVSMLIVGWSSPTQRAPFGREDVRALLLGLLAGLGLSNHHTIVMLAPLGLYAVFRAARLAGARAVGAAVLGLACGLTPYAYVMARASALPVGEGCVWGAPRTFGGLVRHFLRADYGTFQLAISKTKAEPLAQVLSLADTLFSDLLGAPLILVLAVFVFLRTRDRATPRSTYAGHAALVASLLLVGPIFVMRFNLAAHGLASAVTHRFHLLPLALTSVLVAVALDVCVRAVRKGDRSRVDRAAMVVAGAAGVIVVLRAVLSYPAVREHHRPTTENYLRNVLRSVPEHAIVLHSGDDRVGGFMYARCALGLRPDVESVAPVLLLTDWYPPQVSARLGFPVVRGERPEGAPAPVLPARSLVEQLVATGRPVFLTDWFAKGLDRGRPSYPIGPLIRVVGDPREVPDPVTLLALNEELYASLVFEPTLPQPETWAGVRTLDYARPWNVLAEAFDGAGDKARAGACRARARTFTPGSGDAR